MSKSKTFGNDEKNRNFVQFNREFMMDFANLGKENPTAFTVFMFISQHMDGNNALCVSMKAMEEALGMSRSTLSRAVRYLRELGWLCVLKTGTSNVYIINPDIEWTSWANQKRYCKFSTNVIVTPSENIDFMKNSKATTQYKHVDDAFIDSLRQKANEQNEQLVGQREIIDIDMNTKEVC